MADYQSNYTGAQIDAVIGGAVRFDTAQSKTEEQKKQAQANIGLFENVQPENFPTLPYPIKKDVFGNYSLAVDILAEKNLTYKDYYVDGVNGSDSNDGTSAATAFKTFKKALTQTLASSNNNQAYIHITAETVCWDDGLYGEYQIRKPVVIDGNGCLLIWGVEDPEWSAYAQKEGVYVSKDLSSQKCQACVEMSDDNKDMYGLYRGYKPADSIANMIAGTYYWDSTNNLMYVFPRTGANISDIHPTRSL